MSNAKTVMSQAANVWQGPTYIEDVFSTYLYTGNGSTQTITNGIDLAGEGGLVWIKPRGSSTLHQLIDTERGVAKPLHSQLTAAESDISPYSLQAFNSNGFTLGANLYGENASGAAVASWTFRKAPRFFDVVTYTGDGTNGRQIPHNLGSNIGMVICKGVDVVSTWAVKHKDRPTDEGQLNSTNSFAGYGNFPTSFAGFTDSYFTVDAGGSTNANGYTYVAYLFAHDPLGPSGDGSDGLIACGSFTTSAYPLELNLGWEPAYILTKRTDDVGAWWIWDTMRGIATGGNDSYLLANLSNAENSLGNVNNIDVTATGFNIVGTGAFPSSGNYIYIAIRRGPMRQPTSGTEVFAPILVTNATGTKNTTGFPIDLQINAEPNGVHNKFATDRLRGVITTPTDAASPDLRTQTTSAEQSVTGMTRYWDNTGFETASFHNNALRIYWNFRRAPRFFDVVAYTGNGAASYTLQHNLAATPELLIVKCRTVNKFWMAYSPSFSNNRVLYLNDGSDGDIYTSRFPSAPTATTFTVGTSIDPDEVNGNGQRYIAYLFSTLSGVSKVGQYIGNGSSQTIDCGFTSGARFVLAKRTNGSGDWFVWDTARGIVAANDPHLSLNTTAAQVTTNDSVDPDATGFIVNQNATTNINVSGGRYIFLAIA